jgi:uncharacterized C2H2 Zn-finger protein
MPKIKAYKGRGYIIPVEDAKVATAFRCPWTSKVFGTKKAYVSHLKILREDRIHRAIRYSIQDRLLKDLSEQHSFEDIIAWIETHPEFFFDRAVRRGRVGWGARREPLRDKFWIKITYINAVWNESVSNSHSCPRDGVENWGREDGKPTGYPGWSGRIEFQMSHDLGFGSDVMRGVGLNTGTGGGIRGGRYGYDLKMFASDWPNLVVNRALEKLGAGVISNVKLGSPVYFHL